jgi:4-amino-4-deoxy-L-arabinose transferase-like glycosyltransferase
MQIIKRFRYEILIFFLFVILRSFNLGSDMFNTDVFKWKARSYDFSTGVFTLDFEKTIQKYHPGVTLMWLGTAGIKTYNLYYDVFRGETPLDNDVSTVFELHTVQKYWMVIFMGLIFALLFYGLKNVTNFGFALITLLFMNMEPFFIALTRVMHLEGLMTILMFTSFVWFLYFMQDTTNKKVLIVSSLLGALAVLTKTTAIFILLFVGLVLLIKNFKDIRESKVKESLKTLIIWVMFFILFFILLWPAMWTNSLEALQTMYRGVTVIGIEREHIQLYFGQLVEDPGPLYYLVVLGLRTSVWLIGGLVGYLAVKTKLKDKKINEFVFFCFLFSILYLLEVTIPSKKLDRYVLPSLIGLVPISAAFYYYFLERAKEKYELSVNKFFLLFVGMFVPAILCVGFLHPDYFSYYNPVFGGLRTGVNILEPKWVFGQNELIRFLNKEKTDNGYTDFEVTGNFDSYIDDPNIKDKMVVAFPEKYYTQLWPFINSIGARASILDITAHAKNSNYVVYPSWDDQSSKETRFTTEYLDTIEVRGVGIYNVYTKSFQN